MNIVLNHRVEHFAIFENLVFAITSKMLRILTDHIENVCILEYKLLLITICSIRILNNFEVNAKMSFTKIAKCATLLNHPMLSPGPSHSVELIDTGQVFSVLNMSEPSEQAN